VQRRIEGFGFILRGARGQYAQHCSDINLLVVILVKVNNIVTDVSRFAYVFMHTLVRRLPSD